MKNAKKKTVVTAVLLLFSCFFMSCAQTVYSPDGNEAITTDDLIRIKKELQGTATDTSAEKDKITSDSDIVYWTGGGIVWHISRDCSYLEGKSQDEVIVGTEQQALEAGKTHVCTRCGK